ncbi:MAG: hypothetical protein J0G32_03675 [Alphaproteobacteria bacterium]|nr:hypothetical protein [Alphaproteobacteria bacterium]OJV16051.1 MAG: hypothetical protein BGO27_04310 [Alphaproteobacteria bacterium 33-17]
MSGFATLASNLNLEPQKIVLFFQLWTQAGFFEEARLWESLNLIYDQNKAEYVFNYISPDLKNDNASEMIIAKLDYLYNNKVLNDQDLLYFFLYQAQTAFNRELGKERDSLKCDPNNWLCGGDPQQVIAIFNKLGIIDELKPSMKSAHAIVIPGSSTKKMVKTVSKYAEDLSKLPHDNFYFLTGNRPLTKGIDGEETILEIANNLGIKYDLTKPFIPLPSPLSGETLNCKPYIDEKDAAVYYLKKAFPGENIEVDILTNPKLDNGFKNTSKIKIFTVEVDNLRPTTIDNAKSLYKHLESLGFSKENPANVILIGSQPFITRQKISFENIRKEYFPNLGVKFDISAEKANLDANNLLTIFSETAALISEKFNQAVIDGKYQKLEQNLLKVIMFGSRKNAIEGKVLPKMPEETVPTVVIHDKAALLLINKGYELAK